MSNAKTYIVLPGGVTCREKGDGRKKELCLLGIYPCTVAGRARCECKEFNDYIKSLPVFTIEGEARKEGEEFEGELIPVSGEEGTGYFIVRPIKDIKGDLGGECYRTACSNKGANYYNHSTRKHYCKPCALLINDANRIDAMRLYGHELCTFVKDIRDEGKTDCSGHKKDLFGESDMRKVAEMIGDLHYETLTELLRELCLKINKDGGNDYDKGRFLLGDALIQCGDKLSEAHLFMTKVWEISKPFMTPKTNQ